MAETRWVTRRPYGVLVIVLVLVAFGSTLHWHSDWDDQGCQLCHLRHLPGALAPVEQDSVCMILAQQDWSADNPDPGIEAFFDSFSSRAPPLPVPFTV